MLSQHQTDPPLIRHTRLARALALALGLGATAAIAALPSQNSAAWASEQSLSGRGHDAVDVAGPHPLAPARSNIATATAATWVVSNCNDAGAGSLRGRIAQAASNDIVDLSQLACTDIELTSGTLQVTVDRLLIKGSLDNSDPHSPQRPRIRRAASAAPFRIFSHTRTGQLSLTDIQIASGLVVPADGSALGGCIHSNGSVKLVHSVVLNCVAMSTAHWAGGGGIYARNDVSLEEQSVIAGNVVQSSLTAATGGGIQSGGLTSIDSGSVVRNNHAYGVSPNSVDGGGVHARGGLSMIFGELKDNKAHNGGGAYVPPGDATVHLIGSIISGNTVDEGTGRGAGLYLRNDSSIIKYSTIADNSTNYAGGGLFARNDLHLKGSSVIGNHASDKAGGIFVAGSVTIESSTIASNTAGHVAGADLGSDLTHASPRIVIEQSTISGNKSQSARLGTGLLLRHHATVRNSTITSNVGRYTSDRRFGAGITIKDNLQLELSSTIVAGNGSDVDGTVSDSDIGFYNSETGSITISGSHNLFGHVNQDMQLPGDTMLLLDPMLGPLQDNGGLTRTHMPLLRSPAIDNGKANGFTTDQRDSGYARVIGISADIGAVEQHDHIFANGFE